jgi:hypothetical protein
MNYLSMGSAEIVEHANINIGDMIVLNGATSLYPNKDRLTSTTYAN